VTSTHLAISYLILTRIFIITKSQLSVPGNWVLLYTRLAATGRPGHRSSVDLSNVLGSTSLLRRAPLLPCDPVPMIIIGPACPLRQAHVLLCGLVQMVMTHYIMHVLTLGPASLSRQTTMLTRGLTAVGILVATLGLSTASPRPTCCACSDSMRTRTMEQMRY
jgi:hypothetical protein